MIAVVLIKIHGLLPSSYGELLKNSIVANLIEIWHSENYSKGYAKYSNGLLEQWGYNEKFTNGKVIQLYIKYPRNYHMIGTWTSGVPEKPLQVSPKGNTAIAVYSTVSTSSEYYFSWRTIGFWE